MGSSARSAGIGMPDCVISASSPTSLQRHRLAARIGAADDELAMFAVELDGERDNRNPATLQSAFQQRMTRVAQDESIT